MYFILYRTVNLKNGKYYIGVHKTDNLDDGYLGSGKALLKAVQKYGKESFLREILLYVESEEEMYNKEKDYVTESVVKDPLSYNLKIGGSSNFYFINQNKLNHKSNQHLIHSTKLKTDSEYAEKFSKKVSDWNKKRVDSGWKMSESAKQKLSEASKKDWDNNPKRKIKRIRSLESKNNISEGMKNYWKNRKSNKCIDKI